MRRRYAIISCALLSILAGSIFGGCKTEVNAAEGDVYPAFSGQEKQIYLDGRDKISIQGRYVLAVKYESTKKKIAAISKTGTIIPKKKGKTTIRATVVYRKKSGGKKYTKKLSYSLTVLSKTKDYFVLKKRGKIYEITGLQSKAKSKKEIYVPGYLKTSKITKVGEGVFEENRIVEKVHLSDNISYIGRHAFFHSSKLREISFGKAFSSYYNAEGVFNGCENLEKIILDNQNKHFKVEDGILFSQDGTKLCLYPAQREGKEYRIPDSVIALEDSAFADCQELKHVIITENVKLVKDYCFANSGIVSIIVPDSVTTIGKCAFLDCGALSQVALSNNITQLPQKVFGSCASLESITLSEKIAGVAGDTFYGCNRLSTFVLDEKNTNFAVEDGVLFSSDKETLLQYPKGRNNSVYMIKSGTKTIAENAFEGCRFLEKVVMPEGLQTIKRAAFQGADIKEAVIPNSVSILEDYAYNSCGSLTNVTLSDALSTLYANTFSNCMNLKKLTLPRHIETIVWTENSFMGCDNLESIDVSAENAKFVSVNGVLFSKDRKYLYHYPNGKSEEEYTIPKGTKKIQEYAFAGTKWLSKIVVSSGIETIGKNAFRMCESIKEISIPSTVTKIEKGAFADCIRLNVVTLGAKLKKIEEKAFWGCRHMKELVIKSKYLKSSSVGKQVFYKAGQSNYKKFVVKVPKGKKKLYRKIFIKCGLSKRVRVKE